MLLFSHPVISNSLPSLCPGFSVYRILQARILEWQYSFSNIYNSSVQLLSHVQLFATPWNATHQASLSITISRSLLKLMSI